MNRLVKKVNSETSENAGGNFIQGSFGLMGIGALIKGATYVNEGDEVCPWTPTLPDFLLTYGIVNVILPVIFGVFVAYVRYRKPPNAKSLYKWILYIPFLSTVINLGLIIWGLVLLYSHSHSVEYDKYDPNYCDKSLYITSVVIVWLYVGILAATVIFGGIRYLRMKRESG